jgi:hypothetical protein
MACLKPEPYNPSIALNPTLVMHAYICSNQESQVFLTRSTSIISKPDYINNAQVQLNYLSNNLVFNFIKNGEYHYNNGPLKPGDSFALTINQGGTAIQVKELMPNEPRITSIDTTRQINPLVGSTINIEFTIKDTAALNNYYRLYVTKEFYQYIYDYNNILIDSFINQERIPIFGKQLAFIQNDYNKYNTEEILFTDATFNGVLQKCRVYTSDLLLKTSKARPIKITVYIENLSRGLYEFYNDRNAHIWQQKSIIQVPNVVNGNVPNIYGILGAYTQYKKEYLLN